MSYQDFPRLSQENKNFVGTVLFYFSKVFDCIPHDLLTKKLYGYSLSEDTQTFVHKVACVVNLGFAFTD